MSTVNKEANEGWRFAADAARITNETAGIEDQKLDSKEALLEADLNQARATRHPWL